MKKKIILFITLIVILGVCVSIAVFSASGAESDIIEAHRTAAQLYKKMHNGDISFSIATFDSNEQATDIPFDSEISDSEKQTIVGYYKDISITQDQVSYMHAMDQAKQNPKKTEEEAIFAIARDLYTFEQAKELGLYPSEEEMEDIFISETESFQANLEENLEFCSQIGLTQDELIAWMTQRKIENLAKSRFAGQTIASLQEKEEIEDEALAELVQALLLRENGTDLTATITKLYDRYVFLQIGDQITYVNEDSDVESSEVVSE